MLSLNVTTRKLNALIAILLLTGLNLAGYASLPNANAAFDCETQSSIVSNFNGNSIAAGNWIWFSSVLKLKSPVPSTGLVIKVAEQHVVLQVNSTTTLTLHVTKAEVIFSPSATTATTTYDKVNMQWVTTVPSSYTGPVFLSGKAYLVPAGGFPGGINPVTWTAFFRDTGTDAFSVQWQWSAAVYTKFSPSFLSLGVKPVDSNTLSSYQNSDHAGTPENFKSFVTG
ncbi:Uncharacterised protein [uncultured archaeon]|nr:Uncharacterised protein [uncultured archaeon]